MNRHGSSVAYRCEAQEPAESGAFLYRPFNRLRRASVSALLIFSLGEFGSNAMSFPHDIQGMTASARILVATTLNVTPQVEHVTGIKAAI